VKFLKRPRTAIDCDRGLLLLGDSATVELPERCAHSIVTDPPAGIGFMDHAWDSDRGGREEWVRWLARTLLPWVRALRPGGYVAMWALPRTSHWTALALELAGLEIRDSVLHLFGSGMPKGLTAESSEIPEWAGTGLKPAHEVWWIARKPLERRRDTIDDTFAAWGTGVLNIGGCRVDVDAPRELIRSERRDGNITYGDGLHGSRAAGETLLGRWPANVVVSHLEGCADACAPGCAVLELNAQSGDVGSHGGDIAAGKGSIGYKGNPRRNGRAVRKDPRGGAARFFYCPKPSPSERHLGLEHLTPLTGAEATGRKEGAAALANPRTGAGRKGGALNTHPTVKSIALMQWLVRLVTPPGGVVLEPFAGSGSTVIAALLEGRDFLACELAETPRYEQILLGRVEAALAGRFDQIANK
jgi:DNA modification methylase